jgi:hypothetical protein
MAWVAPHLTGGLGNRLFQFAAAAGLAEKWKREVVFLLPRCGETSHGAFHNIFNLLPLVKVLETASEWEVLLEPKSSMYRFFPFPEEPIQANAVIQGWRQSEKYFPKNGVHVDFKHALGEDTLKKLALPHPSKSWFLHVRLGDYRILPHHQVDLRKYYITCLQQVPKDATLYFFSDEPNLCADAFRGLCKQLQISFQVCTTQDEVETLYQMSQCKGGAIVANSTFSWWGAYLAHQDASPEFKAFYPTLWGNGMPPPIDIIPSWGIALDV